MKIFIMPPNSLILYDLVERFGHQPLSVMAELRDRVTGREMESPPLNVTPKDVTKGLKYAGIEVPSGIRGRMAVWGPMVDEAEAAIIMHNTPFTFGCVGCHRTNLLLMYRIRKKNIPTLEVEYPEDEEEGKIMVTKIKTFLEGLK